MGHATIQQTRRYTHLLEGDIVAAAERAERRFVAALERQRDRST